MRTPLLCVLVVCVACGGGLPASSPASGEAGGGAVAAPPVDLTGDVDVVAGKIVKVPRKADLLVDTEVLRGHPVGQRIGPLLGLIPQWHDSLRILGDDPIATHDWVFLTGPSLAAGDKDALLLRAAGDEAAVDNALDALARRSVVPLRPPLSPSPSSPRAVPADLDHAPRVALRAHPQLLVVVPTDSAGETARALTSVRVLPSRRPAEAVRVWMTRPHDTIAELPECLTELRARVVVSPDGGAEIFAEGSCGDAGSASTAADSLRRAINQANTFIVRLATHGLLNGADVTTEGPVLRAHLAASRDQLEATLGAASALLGVAPSQPRSAVKM